MPVILYTPSMLPEWDRVVRESRNGTFLHLRGYMDYHADRFADMWRAHLRRLAHDKSCRHARHDEGVGGYDPVAP